MRMGTMAEWHARAFAMIGQTVVLEGHLDVTLALVNARDAHAVERLATNVFPQLALNRRIELLAGVNDQDVVVAHTAQRMRALVGLRNSLAHSYTLGKHDAESAVFWGWNRGKGTKTFIYKGLPLAVEQAGWTIRRDLWRIAGAYSDRKVWAAFYGFDDRGPGDDLDD